MDSSSRRSDGHRAQHRDFEETLDGLRDEFKPQGVMEESCVATMAQSYVRMAAMLRYENIAALKYHQQRDRELNERIAARMRPKPRDCEPSAIDCGAPDCGGRPSRVRASAGDSPVLGQPRRTIRRAPPTWKA